jgi:hypothetical protein
VFIAYLLNIFEVVSKYFGIKKEEEKKADDDKPKSTH